MSNTSLDAIRAKLQAMETRSSGSNSSDNSLYAHWNIPDNSSSVVRFLPDGDDSNTFFWKEKQMIKLPFPGIKGQDESKKVIVQVPCVEMWGDTCPVLTEIRPWFNDASLDEIARSYWKKRSYLFQGFIIEDGMNEKAEDLPENPIRRFIMSPGIYKLIKSSLLDPDMTEIPTDYQRGTDFRISKTKDGQWADYSTSKYMRNETALTEEQLQAIAKYGLYDLSTLMPARPTAEGLSAIEEMFEASVNGSLYDPDKWADFYRPYGMDRPNSATPGASFGSTAKDNDTPVPNVAVADTTETVSAPSVASAVVETETEKEDSASMSAEAILDKLRKRPA